jgi:uncharacterized RDD family membrane protein YckC
MEATAAELRASYEKFGTTHLLKLRAEGTLTPPALQVVEQILSERGFLATAEQSEALERSRKQRALAHSTASLGSRWLGQFIDAIVSSGPMLVIALVLPNNDTLITAAVLFAVIYLVLWDGLPGGRSVGKRVAGTAVVDARTGQPCGYGRSAVRNLSLLLLGAIDALFIFQRSRQRLGDWMASTIVIEA